MLVLLGGLCGKRYKKKDSCHLQPHTPLTRAITLPQRGLVTCYGNLSLAKYAISIPGRQLRN